MAKHIRINCGGPAIRDYVADAYFAGGTVFNFGVYPDFDLSPVSNPAPLEVYNTCRFSAGYLQYLITGLDAAKSYRARLHWAELNDLRRFRAFVNTVEISSGGTGGMSVVTEAGALAKVYCLSKVFTGATSANIELYETAVNAFISGIEIIEIETPLLLTPFNIQNILPEHYWESESDFEKVTHSQKYQDGGAGFNALNRIAPRTWKLNFTGLSEKEAAIFDDHFESARGELLDFSFTDRKNYVYDAGIRYKDYDKSHDKNKRFIQSRKITLIKYP